MKAVIAAAVVFCLALIGIGAYFATREEGGGPRVVALDAGYQDRLNRGYWAKGASEPKVTLVEYADFQCPACRASYPIIQEVLQANSEILQVQFRYYPLPSHNKAVAAAFAAEAAGRQGKFWEMHDQLFASQTAWSDETVLEFRRTAEKYAEGLGLNVDQFRRDMKDSSIQEVINKDLAEGDKVPVQGTPTILVNGRVLDVSQLSVENLNQIVRQAAEQQS